MPEGAAREPFDGEVGIVGWSSGVINHHDESSRFSAGQELIPTGE